MALAQGRVRGVGRRVVAAGAAAERAAEVATERAAGVARWGGSVVSSGVRSWAVSAGVER
ncbi:hypothetical protein [Microbacterium sp. AK031]|uniref:hypothetical protein n=1 Tax=Microbacterium sp. AK031 TaxID=2723076 RepID=UPI00216A93CC|nr:hypothetical protein [Microbacterium sp. AK031]MCS3842378.1 hypothetical protein [Microbacterium sp. AK031]